MAKIEKIKLRSVDPSAQQRFYCDVLGMRSLGPNTVGYGEREARLSFLPAQAGYLPTPRDLYWKITLAVPDIELACRQLSERGVTVGEPRQFQDVGYLAHFQDPEGYSIELIDHWFKGERPDQDIDPDRFGGGAHLNLLTLRSADIESVTELCERWGMKLLCIEPVTSYGFTLYFFAFADEAPPSDDLHAVVNRTWVYQRPYTLLEVQHLPGKGPFLGPTQGEGGYAGAVVSGLDGGAHQDGLGFEFSE